MNHITNSLAGLGLLLISSATWAEEDYRFVTDEEMIELEGSETVLRVDPKSPEYLTNETWKERISRLSPENAAIVPEYESLEQIFEAFKRARDDEIADWKRRVPALAPEIHCAIRTATINKHLEGLGFPRPVYIYVGSKRPKGCTSWIKQCFNYPWHAAPVVTMGRKLYVFDTAFYPDRPLLAEDWLNLFDLDGVEFEIKKNMKWEGDYDKLKGYFLKYGAPLKKEEELIMKRNLSSSLILKFKEESTPIHPWYRRGPKARFWTETKTKVKIDRCRKYDGGRVTVEASWEDPKKKLKNVRMRLPKFPAKQSPVWIIKNHLGQRFHSHLLDPFLFFGGKDMRSYDAMTMAVQSNRISIYLELGETYWCEDIEKEAKLSEWVVEETD